MNNPRRMAIMLGKLQKNEEIKNIILQRTNEDLNRLQAVDNVLGQFFTEKAFPEFHHSKLGADSKFTPLIDLAQTGLDNKFGLGYGKEQLLEPMVWEELERKRQMIKVREGVERMARESMQGVICADNEIAQKLKQFDSKMADLVAEIDQHIGEALIDTEGKPLDLDKKFLVLQGQLTALDYMLGERNRQLVRLNAEHTIAGKKAEITNKEIDKQEVKAVEVKVKVPPKTVKIRVEETGDSRKKFKVNIALLEKREQMSELEIMERRYKVINGEQL